MTTQSAAWNNVVADPGERKCADVVGTVPVPWAGHFPC